MSIVGKSCELTGPANHPLADGAASRTDFPTIPSVGPPVYAAESGACPHRPQPLLLLVWKHDRR